MTVAPLNPFTPQTVSSLRKIEPPIRWLNDAALRKLMAVFEVVEEKPHRCELVQLILSRGDGYGKSHLLGRLVHELDGRATCVSVADYHDPLTCWVTLLQSMLSELSQPELIHHLPYPPTQLDELTHQLFGFLTVMLADKGVTDTPIPGGNRDDLLERPFEKWDLSDPASTLGIWVKETLTACEQDATREATLVRLLKAATLHTYNDDASAMNWLLVLHRYASDRADEESRHMCLEWILTNQLEVPAETFLQDETQLAGNNLTARQQTLDLLALAKLYRPFLLCFDQTSSLTSSLAKSFGNMLADLVKDEGAHFSIVTANSNVWETAVLPELAPDCLPYLATKMELTGLTREQGRSLAEQRLQNNGDPVEFQERFLKKTWLEEQFAQGSLGQRDFLQRCETRYQEMVPDAIKPSSETETTDIEPIPFVPLIADTMPTVPAPDFTIPAAPAASAPSAENANESPHDLPPIPAMDLPEAAPISQDSPGSSAASMEAAQIPPASILQSASIGETIDTSHTPDVISDETAGPKADADNIGTESPTPVVAEPPAPAEIIKTIESSTDSSFEASRHEQTPNNAIPQPPVSLNQDNAPALEIEKTQIPDQPTSQEGSPTPIAPVPNSFPAFTPLNETPANQAEELKESYQPPVLLPPDQEEPLNKPVEAFDISDSNHPAATIQELAKNLAEPEKTISEETPQAITSPIVEVVPASTVPGSLTPDTASPAEETDTKASIPVLESSVSASEPVLESPPEILGDSSGQVVLAPVAEEVEKTISPASQVAEAPFSPPAPEVIASSLPELEPLNTEATREIPEVSSLAPVESPPETAPETSGDNAGQVVLAPLTEEVEKTISPASQVAEAPFSPPAPKVIASSLPELEPLNTEATQEIPAVSSPTPVESLPETAPETSGDNAGQVVLAPVADEVEKTIPPASQVVEESLTPPAPEVVVSSLAEVEPQNTEAAPGIPEVLADAPEAEPPAAVESSGINPSAELVTSVAEIPSPIAADEVPAIAEPAAAVAVDDQAELRDALLQIIRAHRFASHVAIADELRRKMQRLVSVEETVLCAQSISEIHVYADGPNAAFLWQGED